MALHWCGRFQKGQCHDFSFYQCSSWHRKPPVCQSILTQYTSFAFRSKKQAEIHTSVPPTAVILLNWLSLVDIRTIGSLLKASSVGVSQTLAVPMGNEQHPPQGYLSQNQMKTS
jgi:hypothetical protein